ncbi:aquaporin-like protein [Lentinus tigrinus ALCF2SS1-7]|uniref:Aquaporin-like protein n=1 Tax=Lentinus tigrinus ALCF2SS1-6 TaxID=1328759 RepID=A0A5C2SA34_9APHY|nr:aquaporin-like protein [Lentinus tigrinus ALCF2SS1-6]RPD74732.1 aquaporin-like protein [Lentinus tigrinus ALCF2SS1-7]
MPFSSRHRLNDSTVDPNYQINQPADARRPSLAARIKDDIYAAALEYVGTTVFLLLALGCVQASAAEASSSQYGSNIERVMYIATGFGLSLLVSVWLFYRVTGGLFNPNVSLALLITGVIGPARFVLYAIAQLVGGITAAAIIEGLTPGVLASNTFPAQGINNAQAVFIEMFITSFLVIAVLMMAAEKHAATPFAPIGIGLTIFVCHLFAVYYTGAGMNTARSFGPAVVTGFPYSTQWIYWVGPFLGSLLGAAFYSILKHVRYWRLNPGQDTVDHRESPPDPVRRVRTSISSRRSRSRSMDGSNGGTAVQFANEKPVAPNEVAPAPSAADGVRGRRPNDSPV